MLLAASEPPHASASAREKRFQLVERFFEAAGGAETTTATQAATSKACINPTRIQKQTILSDQEIQFELNNGETWVNKLPRACPNLKFQGGFTWEVRGTQVCSNQQVIYVREDGTPCQLGAFTLVPNAA